MAGPVCYVVGVIMDVTTKDQAKIAEEAGACAVMALEKIPADIRNEGGVARMSDPELIIEIKEGSFNTGYGKGSHWSFCRSSDFTGVGD